ncbi:MAG: NADH:ubiquinone reductase (Na(+)-transporting) subunit A, partial [Bacteroidota bacterium]
NLVKDNVTQDKPLRYISGNVLTGSKIYNEGYVGYYDNMVTVIPEGDYYEMFGWAKPGFNKFSASRAVLSWLIPGRKFKVDTNLHGGPRAYVMTGEYEKVFPMDIYPVQLIKAIMIEDIDLMEKLGIYEVDEEDFALCEYVCTSKTEVQTIVRKGLDLMRKEMS